MEFWAVFVGLVFVACAVQVTFILGDIRTELREVREAIEACLEDEEDEDDEEGQ